MKKNPSFLALIFLPILAWSTEAEIKIPRDIPYYDASIIQENVIAQCKSLGTDFSEHLSKALVDNGYTTAALDALDTSKGTVFDVKITNVFSKGNAFMGHMKSASAAVKVYKDGQIISTKTFTRDSRGGFGAGFKGSCDVLDRVTTALGNDIAHWYKKQD